LKSGVCASQTRVACTSGIHIGPAVLASSQNLIDLTGAQRYSSAVSRTSTVFSATLQCPYMIALHDVHAPVQKGRCRFHSESSSHNYMESGDHLQRSGCAPTETGLSELSTILWMSCCCSPTRTHGRHVILMKNSVYSLIDYVRKYSSSFRHGDRSFPKVLRSLVISQVNQNAQPAFQHLRRGDRWETRV